MSGKATPRIGFEEKAYIASAPLDETNTPAAATWAEWKEARDINPANGAARADISHRESRVRYERNAQDQIEVSVSCVVKADDTQLQTILAAKESGGTVPMLFIPGDEADGQDGHAANWSVVQANRSSSLTGEMTYDLIFVPTSFYSVFSPTTP